MGSPAIPKSTVASVIERDGGICVLQISDDCLGVASCADHRANRQSGGAKHRVLDQPSNLIAACGICNGLKEQAKGDLLADLIRRGVRLLQDSTHRKTALRAIVTTVIYPDGREFYLLDDYTREEVDRVRSDAEGT